MLSSEPTTFIIAALVILTLGTTFGWLLARGKAILLTERTSELEKTCNRLEQWAKDAKKEADRATELARREKRRADEQFKVIEDATNETRATWTLYRQQSIGAGNAQAWLFREIGRVVSSYNRRADGYGFPHYQIPERLSNVLSTYRDEHLDEQRAKNAKNALVVANARKADPHDKPDLLEGNGG